MGFKDRSQKTLEWCWWHLSVSGTKGCVRLWIVQCRSKF